MPALPTGTVTFLYTDIEGSTRLAERHPEAMRAAHVRHDRLLREVIAAQGGHVFRPTGDGVRAVFATAPAAAAAAAAAQRALRAQDWAELGELRVRMALHTGAADLREGDYFGLALNRVARLRDAAHGGQILLSQATRDLARDDLAPGVAVHDLGEHRLRDLQRPERVYQLVTPDLPAAFPPLRSPDALPNNLPLQLTRFVGREQELAQVAALLARRLVTLTGPGGSGKTRLALQVAADRLPEYPDGVWLAELAGLAAPALVAQAVAQAVGVREDPGRPLVVTLTDALRPKRLLLVLDNCEHLLDACARLADTLLRVCPHLTVLATSREALGVAGETAWPVPSLALPDLADPRHLPPVAALGQYAAVALFLDRALAAQPAFRLTDQNAPAVAQICRRLDGMPLAIELAAARVRVLPPEQLLTRLEDRFRLLTGGSRTALERHQTLRAAVDWSYDLLHADERAVFDRLSVFAGGWTLEAAETVCAGDGIAAEDVLDLLARLVDKSLVAAEDPEDGTARYRLLETLRQYGGQRLTADGKAAAVHERHAAYYLALAEQSGVLRPDADPASLDVLERANDNLRAALDWLAAHGPHHAALRLACHAAELWSRRGRMGEGLARLTAVLALPGAAAPSADRVLALYQASKFARYSGNLGAARAFAQASADCSEATGDQLGRALATSALGLTARFEGDLQAAFAWHEQALGLFRQMGDELGTAMELNRMAGAVSGLGNAGEARRLHEAALAICERHPHETGTNWSLVHGWSLAHLGDVAADRGEYDLARSRYAESLAVIRRVGYPPIIAKALEGLAAVAVVERDHDRALRLLGAAATLHETAGARALSADQERVRRVTERARAGANPDEVVAAWSTGRAMPLEEVVADALRASSRAGLP